jgi:hypothetical protein
LETALQGEAPEEGKVRAALGKLLMPAAIATTTAAGTDAGHAVGALVGQALKLLSGS